MWLHERVRGRYPNNRSPESEIASVSLLCNADTTDDQLGDVDPYAFG